MTEVLKEFGGDPIILKEGRLKTYKNWSYDKVRGANCTSIKLAEAGFVFSGSNQSDTDAKCVFCSKELTFDMEDEPLEEHHKRQPDCDFMKLKKSEEDYTVDDVLVLLCSHLADKMASKMIDAQETVVESYGDELKVVDEGITGKKTAPKKKAGSRQK